MWAWISKDQGKPFILGNRHKAIHTAINMICCSTRLLHMHMRHGKRGQRTTKIFRLEARRLGIFTAIRKSQASIYRLHKAYLCVVIAAQKKIWHYTLKYHRRSAMKFSYLLYQKLPKHYKVTHPASLSYQISQQKKFQSRHRTQDFLLQSPLKYLLLLKSLVWPLLLGPIII